jgi:hypothetical protein
MKTHLLRDRLINKRTALLKEKSNELIKSNDPKLHIEGLGLQVETINILLDASTGSTYFNVDEEQSWATKTAGIPSFEKLILKAMEATEQNEKDKLDMVQTWESMKSGIKHNVKADEAGCKRIKKAYSEVSKFAALGKCKEALESQNIQKEVLKFNAKLKEFAQDNNLISIDAHNVLSGPDNFGFFIDPVHLHLKAMQKWPIPRTTKAFLIFLLKEIFSKKKYWLLSVWCLLVALALVLLLSENGALLPAIEIAF